MYKNLNGKITLITGASTGIGESTARLFAECGSHLILTARRVEKLEKLKTELLEKHKDLKIFTYSLDVRNKESVEAFAKAIPKELNEIDVLVNNAGLALGVKHAFENDLAQIEQMIDTNVKGIFYMLRFFLPAMKDRNRGHIINISSIAGLEGYPGGTGYCASKFAVEGITEALRKELVATKLRVTTICPGLVGNTEFSLVRLGNADSAKKVYDGIEALTPEDVADSIVYVASRPAHVQISSVVMMPTNQASAQVVHREQKS